MNMRYILVLLLTISLGAAGQYSPTSAKTKFVQGIAIGSKDTSAFNAADSMVLTIGRDSVLYWRYKGNWMAVTTTASLIPYKFIADTFFVTGYTTRGRTKHIIDSLGALKLNISDTASMLSPYARSSSYVPYTGAVASVNLGEFRLTSRSVATDSILARSSAGGRIVSNSGSTIAEYGAGGGTNFDFHGFAGYNANRSSSYTSRSFTDKNYVDSSAALRLRISDTAAMLANRLRISDTLTMLSRYLRKTDTLTMLVPYLRKTDTASMLSNRLRISDTASMLSARPLNNRFLDSISTIRALANTRGTIFGSGTINTVPKFTASGTIGNSNITDNGTTITLGSNTRINGSIGYGIDPSTSVGTYLNRPITGATTSYANFISGITQSDVTSIAYYNRTFAATQAASFTLGSLNHYTASQGTFGVGSTVTNQYGFNADGTLIGATNNFGFRGNIASGINRWNLYMEGSANNYLNGRTLFKLSPTDDGLRKVQIDGGIISSGNSSSNGYFLGAVNNSISRWNIGTNGLLLSHNINIFSPATVDNPAIPSWSMYMGGGAGWDYWEINRAVAGSTTPATLIRLTNSGRLGIGTTTPATALEVMAVNVGEYFRAGGGTLSDRSIRFSNYSVSGLSGVGHRIDAPNASANLSLAINGTDALILNSDRSALFSNGVTAQRGRFTSLVLNKDSIPANTTNIWAMTIDTSGTIGTQKLRRRSIATVHAGAIAFDTTSRVLTITQLDGNTTTALIPRGTASGASGITALSSSKVGNLVTVAGDNGSTTTFSIRDADSASTVRFSDTATMLAPYLRKSDTATMLSPYRRTSTLIEQSEVNNLGLALSERVSVFDTATMLAPFVQYSDTANQMNGYLRKNFSLLLQDTSTAFNPYLRKSDTATALAPFVQYSDTSNMLSPYRRTSTLIQQSEVSGLSTSLGLKLNISDTLTMLNNRLRISDTLNMLSNYRRTTTLIQNSGLANSTISGVALGGSLNNLSSGNGLVGSNYNGSAAQSWRVDTTTISTKANVSGALVGYATTAQNSLKLNISDTAAMLANRLRISDTLTMLSRYLRKSDTANLVAPYLRKTDTTSMLSGYTRLQRFNDSLTAVQARIQTKQPLGAYITLADSSTILAGRWLPNRSADSIAVIRALANTKLNISDTSSMLANRLKISDTLTMLSNRLKISDTSNMLSPYYRTATATAALAAKLNVSDTSTMLLPYLRKTDTLNMLSPYRRTSTLIQQSEVSGLTTSLGLKLNISDTLTMLSRYLRKTDTASMLAPFVQYSDTANQTNGYLRKNFALLLQDTSTALSNYRRTSTKILNSDLANSTISGVALGGSLNNHLNGYGISGTAYNGALTQTWIIDTSAISTKANVTGSLVAKLNISDTATMLSNRLRISDTATMLTRYLRKSDTLTMLVPYLRKTDTSNMLSPYRRTSTLIQQSEVSGLSTSLGLKLNISDTATMLSNRLKISDTLTMLSRYLRKTDTATMLAPFVQYSDTSNQMSGYLRKNFALLLQDTSSAFGNYLRKTDTLTMLSRYLRKTDTATMLAPFVQYSDTANQMNNYLRKNFALLLQDTATAFSVRPLNNRFTDSIATIRALANSKGLGTVTSVATNNGTGISGGIITTTGTLAIDTVLLSTRAWRQKSVDSLNGLINARVRFTDTSTMLTPYLRKSDTLSMLSPYRRTSTLIQQSEVNGLSTSIGLKLNISDTLAMLSNRLRISDTLTMLSRYLRKSDTTNMLSNYARLSGAAFTGSITTDQISGFGGNTPVSGWLTNRLSLGRSSSNNYSWIQGGGSSSVEPLSLQGAGSNVLIGTTVNGAGDEKLQVAGSGLFQGNLNLASAGNNLTLSRSGFTNWNAFVGTVGGVSGLQIGAGSSTYLSLNQSNGAADFASNIYVKGGNARDTGNGVHLFYANDFAQIQLNGVGGGAIDFSTDGVDTKGRILYDNVVNEMVIRTNNANALSINGSQKATFADSVIAKSLKRDGGTSSQFLKADGSVDNSTYLTSASITGKLNISDTSAMLSRYRRTTTKITNSDLANSTISGVSLGSNLNNISAGNGLSGADYNGGTAQSWRVDTSAISTKANVTGALVAKLNISDTSTMLSNRLRISDTLTMLSRYLRKSDTLTMLSPYRRTSTLIQQSEVNGLSASLAAKLNISDTSSMLSNYARLSGANFTGVVGARSASLSAGGVAIKLVPSADGTYGSSNFQQWYRADGTTARGFLGYGSNNDQRFQIATTESGGSFQVFTGNATLALNIQSNQTAAFTDSVIASSFKRIGGTSSQFLKADGSVDNNTYATTAQNALKLNISDTLPMLSNYRRTTTKITNSDLANSTISGVSLGSNLNNLSAGNGLVGSAYNGSSSQTFRVDTGRAVSQIVTGGSLNKVRDSIINLIPTSTPISGTYTPTISNNLNITSSSANITRYSVIGDMVTVSGTLVINPTNATGTVLFNIDLPVLTTMTSYHQLSGTATGYPGGATNNKTVYIQGGGSSAATFIYNSNQNSNPDLISFVLTYQILQNNEYQILQNNE